VLEYVRHNIRTHTPQQTRGVIVALRSFLRFLHYQGLMRTDLASVVPAVAQRRMSDLPKHLPAAAVHQVLNQCEQTTPVGKRDYAILLLLARLGLRACEVAALRLEDIDWDHSQIAYSDRLRTPFRFKSDTESDSYRTAFQFKADSVPIQAGHRSD
jgi:integrase